MNTSTPGLSDRIHVLVSELEGLRSDTQHTGNLQSALFAILSAYLGFGFTYLVNTCAFQSVWTGISTYACTQVPWWLFYAASVPVLAVLYFILFLFGDVLMRDVYFLEVEREVHHLLGRPQTHGLRLPVPSSFLLSRSIWDDARRPFKLTAGWYAFLFSAALVFAGFSYAATVAGLASPGPGPWIATGLIGLLWIYFLYLFGWLAATTQRRGREARGYLLAELSKPVIPASDVSDHADGMPTQP